MNSKEEIFQIWTHRVMVARRMYGHMIDVYWRFQLILFDIPTICLPITILTLTIIGMGIDDMNVQKKVNYAITAISGLSTMMSLLNKFMNFNETIYKCRNIKLDYEHLNIEIEMMMSTSNHIDLTDDQIRSIQSKLEGIMYKDDGIMPENVQMQFMGHQKEIL